VTDPVAVLLKFGFLAVLYLFLLWVVRSALKDMAGSGRLPDEEEEEAAAGRQRGAAMDLRSGVRPRLEVIAALGYEPGTAFELGDSATLGRSPTADVRIDDPYASSAHARIFPRGQFMYIEDMGSTNGTYLNGRQLRKPEQLRVADVVRIGDTEYRYQE
jgi:pSer/pThr/pTyr-binding forkhead associated (FHA) protein